MILRDITEVRAPAAAIFRFFEQMERHYLHWHPDHRLFRWVDGRGVAENTVFYFEEIIAGRLLKKRVVFTRIERDRHIEFAPTSRLMRLFLPRMLFRVEPTPGAACRVVAEIHLRMGPLARRLRRRELDAVREHMRLEGVNLAAIVERESAGAGAGAAPADHDAATGPAAAAGAAHMLHHVSLGVRDIERAVRFYDAVAAPLGYVRVWSDLAGGAKNRAVGYGRPGEGDALALKETPVSAPAPGPGFHLAFAAPSRAAVARFHELALLHGGQDNGAPGLRPAYGEHYYASFVVDPDGHRLEAVTTRPPASA